MAAAAVSVGGDGVEAESISSSAVDEDPPLAVDADDRDDAGSRAGPCCTHENREWGTFDRLKGQ